MAKFLIHWIGGKTEEIEGNDRAYAFTHAGYSVGALRAVDWIEDLSNKPLHEMPEEEQIENRRIIIKQEKERVDKLTEVQAKNMLKYLIDRIYNKDGTPTILMINGYDDVFRHTLGDAFEVAERE